MYKTVFILFLLAHVLGDFYFQSQKLSEQKEKSIKKLLLHNVYYTLTCFVVVLPVVNIWLIIAAFFMSLSHLIIDILKWYLIKRKIYELNTNNIRIYYVIDQLAHFVCIFIVSVFVASKCEYINVLLGIDNIFDIVGINKLKTLSYILLILLIWKPTNITIKKVLSAYKPIENDDSGNDKDRNAGGFIGFLERIVILLLLSINQYSAIG